MRQIQPLMALDEAKSLGYFEREVFQGVDMSDVNLPGARLPYANLKRVRLTSANFEKAILYEINLEDAVLGQVYTIAPEQVDQMPNPNDVVPFRMA
jgi:uncharacterized protein YjbI with pentapeptide repeats